MCNLKLYFLRRKEIAFQSNSISDFAVIDICHISSLSILSFWKDIGFFNMWKGYRIFVRRPHSFPQWLPGHSVCSWHNLPLGTEYLGFLLSSSLKWLYARISYWLSELADNLDCFLLVHNGASGTLNISCQFLRESSYFLPTSLCSIKVSF